MFTHASFLEVAVIWVEKDHYNSYILFHTHQKSIYFFMSPARGSLFIKILSFAMSVAFFCTYSMHSKIISSELTIFSRNFSVRFSEIYDVAITSMMSKSMMSQSHSMLLRTRLALRYIVLQK